MFERDVRIRVAREIKNLFPLFRYLILQTETHAFCLGLACAALLGFYPACLVMLAVLKYILHWNAAYVVLLDTLRTTQTERYPWMGFLRGQFRAQ